MKKTIGKITILSAAVTAALFAINLLLGLFFGFIIGCEFWGGEIVEHIGFGVRFCKFYPLTSIDEISTGVGSLVYFEPISLVVTFLICVAVGCVFCVLRKFVRSIKNKSSEQKNET